MSIARAINRAAQRSGSPPKQTGQRATLPAPVGGWNTRDALAATEPLYALELENFFPTRGRVSLRPGFNEEVDVGETVPVATLFSWMSGSSKKLYAVAGGKVHLVESNDNADTIPSEAVTTGITADNWQGANYGGNGILVNGVDAPLRIDRMGDWVAHGYTGTDLTPSALFQVLPFKNRLFFLEKDTASMWYGGTSAVTGALEKFDFQYVFPGGGNVSNFGSITLDAGDGVDDLLCIFMESGHLLVYQGTDISSADHWAIVGTFFIGPVIGPRSVIKFGGDLIAITSDGYLPILPLLKGEQQNQVATSDIISSAVAEDVARYEALSGWQAIFYPRANWLLFNVPETDSGDAHQHVMNTLTGAWCRFTGMDSSAWALHCGRLYFGGKDGKVNLADESRTDEGEPVRGIAQTAFSYLGGQGDKKLSMVRGLFEFSQGTSVTMHVETDFETRLDTPIVTAFESAGTKWGAAPWGTFAWNRPVNFSRQWSITNRMGAAVSIRMSASGLGNELHWHATDVIFEKAQAIFG